MTNEKPRSVLSARRERRAGLLEAARAHNGEALVRDCLDCHGQGSHDTEWDTDQFERWLLGVMRKAAQ